MTASPRRGDTPFPTATRARTEIRVGGEGYYRPTPTEVAAGWLQGFVVETRAHQQAASPGVALDDTLRPALRRGPCYVSFSGGRDSSAVLAAATALARREGYADPVPVTERYPARPATDEAAWQEGVVSHLGLRDWIRIDFGEEADLVGPVARCGLKRRGLIWPATLHVKTTTLSRLSGGWLLTGEGGDEIFGDRRVTPWHYLRKGQGPPRRLAARHCVASLLPERRRRSALLRGLRQRDLQPWLRPGVQERHLELVAAQMAAEPLRWNRSTRWMASHKGAVMLKRNFRVLAAEHDVTLLEPLLDPSFVAAMARAGGWLGYPGRAAAMTEHFGGLLPEAVLRRTSKATFNQAYFGDETRAFARTWDGAGVDPDLVDPDRLREEWRSPHPSALSSLLLQRSWLASQ